MVRKFHNHKLQTNPWHFEEKPHSNHEALGKQTKQSNQISLPHLLTLFLSLSLFSILSTRSPIYSLPSPSLSLSLSLSLCVPLSTLFSLSFSTLYSLCLSLLCLSLRLSLLCLPLYVCLYSLALSFSLSLSLSTLSLSLYSLSLYTLFSTCTPLYSLYT